MQIVIDIDEEIYKRALPYKDLPIVSNLANDFSELTYAIANGAPLPKGHGDLIDRDDLLAYSYCTDDWSGEINIVDVMTVKKADAIIEADKA